MLIATVTRQLQSHVLCNINVAVIPGIDTPPLTNVLMTLHVIKSILLDAFPMRAIGGEMELHARAIVRSTRLFPAILTHRDSSITLQLMNTTAAFDRFLSGSSEVLISIKHTSRVLNGGSVSDHASGGLLLNRSSSVVLAYSDLLHFTSIRDT